MKKRKFDVDFWDIAIKAAVAFFALLLALAFFGPENGKPRNLPLLCALLALIIVPWAVNAVRSVRLLLKIKNRFAERGATDIKLHINPFGAFLRGNYGLFCKYDNTAYSVVALLRKNAGFACYFASDTRVEYYKSSRHTIAQGGYGNQKHGIRKGAVYTRCVGKRRIKWACYGTDMAHKKLVIFNKMPSYVNSYAVRGNIESGMTVFENATVYDERSLEKFFA